MLISRFHLQVRRRPEAQQQQKGADMELDQAIQERRSIRGFTNEPVSRDLLEEVIALANRAPSSMNTQPWHLHVLTGEPLERVRQGNTERMLGGVTPTRDIQDYAAYEGEHRARQIEIAVQLFEAMGIERNDKERRQDWVMRGFRQFDAPVSIVVCFDRSLLSNTIAHFDTGAMTYGLVLAAWNRGLGAVINGQGIMQSPVVREVAQIPEDQVILTCVALGWPDEDFVANSVVSRRRPVENAARFLGFEG
jgi:nitroreductase